jgi:hypothetical protein
MKTDRYYTAITIILVLLLAIALRMNATEVTYVVNPPAFEAAVNTTFDFEEEAYIKDIPFNTECISTQCKYNKAVNEAFEMPEENYVNDIPFNTEKISTESAYKNATEVEFEFEEETYIDDIPFETNSITQSYLQSHFAEGK